MKRIPVLFFTVFLLNIFSANNIFAARPRDLGDFTGHPPFHIYKENLISPSGLTPDKIKSIYNLPKSGGKGTIAIIDAYSYPNAQSDLNIFSSTFNLPTCTIKNNCLEIHAIGSPKTNTGWETETALDIQWAHAIAPNAKILLVEAKTAAGINLRDAISYAAHRSDVVAVSMSWGGPEFAAVNSYDNLFTSKYNMVFFASSGDSGNGVSWPAVSPNVIGVGGTSLIGKTETAWTGSGGGVSIYEKEPNYQINFNISKNNNMRTVPDISYNADPKSGYAIYTTAGHSPNSGWLVVGGTSAAAPQWAAIRALSGNFTINSLYKDAKSNYGSFFKDIISGKNGSCGYECNAHAGYDFVTGLGSPKKSNF